MNNIESFRVKIEKEMKSGFLTVLILYIIERSDEPIYGYRIIQELNEATKNRLVFQEGTVYPILRSLQTQEFVTPYLGESPTGAPRKYYRITGSGRTALKEGLGSMKVFRESIDAIFRSLEVEG